MHFVLINQCYHPDTASTGQILHDLAEYMASEGHRITVVTSRQRYGTDQLLEVGDEQMGNITVRRLVGTRFGKRTLPGRIADFASFYALACRELMRHTEADAWLVLTSPPMIGVFADAVAQAARLSGTRPPAVVHWVMDLYPEATHAHGMLRPGHPIYRVCKALMRAAFSRSAGLIALGEDMRDLIVPPPIPPPPPTPPPPPPPSLMGTPNGLASKVHVIHPWADGSTLVPVDRGTNPLAAELGLAETFNLVYSGNLGLAHDMETFVSAMEATKAEAGDPRGLRWVFIGSGKRYEQLAEKAKSAGYGHVRLLPFMPRSKLPQSLGLADVHLISQLPAFTGVVVPSKLFGILAAGRPALFVGPGDSECARVIRRHGVGEVVEVGDTAGLLGAIGALRRPGAAGAMGRAAREVFTARYDKPLACRTIEGLLTSSAGG